MATLRHPLFGGNSGYSLNECAAGGLRCVQSMISLAANPTATDVYRICKLPAGHRVVDVALISDDMDANGSPTFTVDVGIEDEIGATTDDDIFFVLSTLPGVAGGISKCALKAMTDLAAVDNDRWVTITIGVAAATFAAGEIGVCLTTRPDQTLEAAVAAEAV